jgi:TetR/AcrR family transcriptional repressor of nem operon
MARHSRQEAAETRARILGIASRAIRAHGIDGTAIPALMRDAGLTHGSFYAHFASKDALVEEACAHAFQRSASVQEATAAAAGEGAALVEIVERYLIARFERLAPAHAAGVAPALLAGIAGAISLSRAVDDPALSARILRDALAFWTRVLGGARGRSRR